MWHHLDPCSSKKHLIEKFFSKAQYTQPARIELVVLDNIYTDVLGFRLVFTCLNKINDAYLCGFFLPWIAKILETSMTNQILFFTI